MEIPIMLPVVTLWEFCSTFNAHPNEISRAIGWNPPIPVEATEEDAQKIGRLLGAKYIIKLTSSEFLIMGAKK